MKMNLVIALAPLGWCAATVHRSQGVIKSADVHVVSAGKTKINPPLVDVDTDKKFFGPPFPADYPDDISPHTSKKMFKDGGVYPKVQEQGFFDKDYVKDENSDGGEWKAQMDYDTARTKTQNKKRQYENAAKRAENEKKEADKVKEEVDKLKKKEEDAAKEAKKAEEATKKAEEKTHDAKEAVDGKIADANEKANDKKESVEEEKKKKEEEMEKEVKDAKEALDNQRDSYKNCLEELRQAKAKLEEVERQKAELLKRHASGVGLPTPDFEEEKKELDEAHAKSEAAQKKYASALADLAAAQKETEAAKQALAAERADTEKANERVKHEEVELHQAKADLEATKETLRHMRGAEAVPGGVPETPAPKSAAVSRGSIAIAAICLGFLAV